MECWYHVLASCTGYTWCEQHQALLLGLCSLGPQSIHYLLISFAGVSEEWSAACKTKGKRNSSVAELESDWMCWTAFVLRFQEVNVISWLYCSIHNIGWSANIVSCTSVLVWCASREESSRAVRLVRQSPEGSIGSRHAHFKVISNVSDKFNYTGGYHAAHRQLYSAVCGVVGGLGGRRFTRYLLLVLVQFILACCVPAPPTYCLATNNYPYMYYLHDYLSPQQLMRVGIGWNMSWTVADCLHNNMYKRTL